MIVAEARDMAITDQQPECCTCRRSTFTRFGGEAGVECTSCDADFDRLVRSGRMVVGTSEVAQPTPAGECQPSPKGAS